MWSGNDCLSVDMMLRNLGWNILRGVMMKLVQV